MRVRALLPGGVVVAELSPPPGGEFSIALSGRQATWTLQFGLAEGKSPPVRYRMMIERPSAVGSASTRCADVLRARGVNAWVSVISGPPAASGILFPGLGAMAVSVAPAGKLTAASPAPGAPTVLLIGGGTTLRGDLAGLGCDPGQVQLNFWDTGKGKPPTLTLADPVAARCAGAPASRRVHRTPQLRNGHRGRSGRSARSAACHWSATSSTSRASSSSDGHAHVIRP